MEMSIERVALTQHQLEQILIDGISNREKGLTVICNQVPIDESSKVDILCHDKDGHLVILELETTGDDKILFEGLKCLDFIDRFKAMLKATYKNFQINEKETPRLVLVAPNFSRTLLGVVEHISGIQIELYKWDYLKLGDNKGLHIYPISLSNLMFGATLPNLTLGGTLLDLPPTVTETGERKLPEKEEIRQLLTQTIQTQEKEEIKKEKKKSWLGK